MSTSYKAADIAALPSDRTLNATVLLAPGVSNTGPSTNSQDSASQAITIAGAMSFENLFLVNGVVLNENLRGQGVPLFIEDAIQETTVTSGAVSAEFGPSPAASSTPSRSREATPSAGPSGPRSPTTGGES